jgi:hypothetical protein
VTLPIATQPALALDQVTPVRLVFVLGPDPARVLAAAARLQEPAAVPLAEPIGSLLVGWDLGTPELGPPALVTADAWLLAVRRLTLGLLETDGQQRVVAAVPGRWWSLMYLRRLFPDAVFVLAVDPADDPEWAGQLPLLRIADDLADDASMEAEVDRRCSRSAGREVLVLLGSGRSGTTWLHSMLCASPHVTGTALGETSVFQLVEPTFRLLGNDGQDGRVVALLQDFVREVLPHGPDTIVCEKTPAHVHVIPVIRRLLPGASYVHLVRDGRDVAMSLYALDGAYPDLPAAARAWVQAVTAVDRDLTGAKRQRLVRYEDLLSDAPHLVEQLWSWLGLSVDDTTRRTLRDRVGTQITPLPSKHAPGSGRWATLAPGPLAELTRACAPALSRWGYHEPPTDRR